MSERKQLPSRSAGGAHTAERVLRVSVACVPSRLVVGVRTWLILRTLLRVVISPCQSFNQLRKLRSMIKARRAVPWCAYVNTSDMEKLCCGAGQLLP